MNGMTPREHNDMRDLLLANTQRIRPAGRSRALISAGLAVALVAVVVGTVILGSLGLGRQAAPPSVDPSHLSNPHEWPPFTWPENRMILLPDPDLTWESLYGALEWVDDQGLLIESLQGFERLEGTDIQPWTAEKADGSGKCILLRTHDGSGFDQIGCSSDGGMTWVDRAVGDALLRFYATRIEIMVIRQPSGTAPDAP